MAAYWVVTGGELRDEAAMQEYARQFKPIAERYGARVIAGRGRKAVREGRAAARVVLVEFSSWERAVACYEDPQYQAAMVFAQQAGERELIIVEGS